MTEKTSYSATEFSRSADGAASRRPELDSVCVYCGSTDGRNPVFLETAHQLGRLLAEDGIRLIWGGGSIGLMGAVARAVLDHGGSVTGIIPQFLVDRELSFEGASELIVTEDMHTRKRQMFERADAFVALPGGIGTLEELVEQMTWAQLGRHRKPILIANIAGFWDPLLALIDHMRDSGFIRPQWEVRPLVATRVEDIIPMLRAAIRPPLIAEERDIGRKM
ncbi:TIGR00730 family Rossman fold protein [Blastochloris viridis]|uniref:Cytokinin riboside 5'-monophosphate phosphoribohydrolase n=1 Tax=Blastochloris viridis TaxID=1079 RepID=A0A0H5B7G8_BLAVI|nr:TIGR00730 family Rossman fold protein [Blastochloris viridis]ALK08596.1 LOG family protein ORF6 in fasciation locus [Blastochloris viridis]BAR98115.1 lysine decarboxylase family [Blastochloris viridis]CUU41259.1 LOG family protein yvdD [Blastochloris viridis]